jgi:uncharacterized protein YndB with AHSA1/START domain
MPHVDWPAAVAAALASLLFGAPACASAGATDPGYTIKDTSFRDPVNGRVQQLTLEVAAPADKVWAALSTDDGLRGWTAPVVHVDLMNDGILEASYSISSHIGDRENIRNQIVAYVPGRLIVYRNVHVPKGAPPDFALLAAVRTSVEIEPIDPGHTRLVESEVGFGEGAGFDALYAHFSSGNRYEFEALARSVLGHPVDWAAEAAKAKASVGDQSK